MNQFRRFFSFRSQTVKQASILLAVTAILSNILGLARNLIFNRFIPFDQLDIYNTSFTISDLLFNIFILGAITSVVIPLMSGLLSQKKEEQAWRITNQLLSWATVFFLVVISILSIGMPLLVAKLFHFGTAYSANLIYLSRLMLIQTVFFSWSFIIGALLNAKRRFAAYALAPLLYNLVLIIGGVIASRFGIVAITYCVILGSFAHFFIQYYEAHKDGYRFHLDLRLSPEVNSVMRMMVPRSVSLGTTQIVMAVYNSLASGLTHGSYTIFKELNDLQTTPTVVVANSISSASFPAIAAAISQKDYSSTNQLLTKATRIGLFILLPCVGFGLILRAQITRLYFGIGGISWQQTGIGIHTFSWFILGIIPSSLVVILARLFYAHKDTRTPMLISIIASLGSILIGYTGIVHLNGDVSVIALAETAIAFIQCSLYLAVLNRRGHFNLFTSELRSSTLRYIIGTLQAVGATWTTLWLVDLLYHTSGWLSTHQVVGLFLQTLAAASVGTVFYLGYSSRVNKEELSWLKTRNFSQK